MFPYKCEDFHLAITIVLKTLNSKARCHGIGTNSSGMHLIVCFDFRGNRS